MPSACQPRTFCLLATLLIMLPLASCAYGPPAVKGAAINASRASRTALEMHDTNSDGSISGEELDQSPGLKAALARVDADSNGAVTGNEIAERIKAWQQMGVAVMSFNVTVTLDGRPLSGATVTFEPEPFLGEGIQGASVVTDDYGSGGASIAEELRDDPMIPGMHLGLYRVKISKQEGGRELVPLKYNEQTVLGQEVSRDVPEILSSRVAYALSSK
jgi:hypothetical protein